MQQSCTEFFQYTSGHWHWDEEQQLRDRYSPFNVPELQRVAASSVEAGKCIDMTKLVEGSFNKTFRLRMDNGINAIARIPHPIAGPRCYMTALEVATMDFVRILLSCIELHVILTRWQARSVLGIPTPRVYTWSADVNNPVGSEYIIMEEAPGVKLVDVWDDLSLEQKIEIMKDLVSLEKRMLSLSFNRSGWDAGSGYIPIANWHLVTATYTMLTKLFQAARQLRSLATCQWMLKAQ